MWVTAGYASTVVRKLLNDGSTTGITTPFTTNTNHWR